MLFEESHWRRLMLQDYSSSTHMLEDFSFKLSKFVNGYLSQANFHFRGFLETRSIMETLELHLGQTWDVYCPHLKTLAYPPQFFGQTQLQTRLRLDFQNSMDECESDALKRISFTPGIMMKSLAIFLKQRPNGRQSNVISCGP